MPWWHGCFLFYVIPAKAGIHVSAIGFRLKDYRNDVQGRTNAVVAWMPKNGDVQRWTNAVVAWMLPVLRHTGESRYPCSNGWIVKMT
jgi:hypothetical protein